MIQALIGNVSKAAEIVVNRAEGLNCLLKIGILRPKPWF